MVLSISKGNSKENYPHVSHNRPSYPRIANPLADIPPGVNREDPDNRALHIPCSLRAKGSRRIRSVSDTDARRRTTFGAGPKYFRTGSRHKPNVLQAVTQQDNSLTKG